MPQRSASYTIAFAAAICVVCSLLVSGTAVGLRNRQEINAALDKQRSVLMAAGLVKPDESVSRDQIFELFKSVNPVVIDLKTGETVDIENPLEFNQTAASQDPTRSHTAPRNRALVRRIPNQALIYKVLDAAGRIETIVLPIEGKGAWSTMYGYLALAADGNTVLGITFYKHGETPGLGGEIDSPRWEALWPGRKVYGAEGKVRLSVIKGRTGSPEENPHEVDGLSGATVTSRGVTNTIHFWLGENGFGPFLEKMRRGDAAVASLEQRR